MFIKCVYVYALEMFVCILHTHKHTNANEQWECKYVYSKFNTVAIVLCECIY